MTKIKIKKLIWDDWNVKHIAKHKVEMDEVEVAAENMVAHKRGRNNKYLAMGRSGERILTLVIGREDAGIYYLLTARDSSKKERRLVYEKEKFQG